MNDNTKVQSSYENIIKRFNDTMRASSPVLFKSAFMDTIARFGNGMPNMTPIQNARVKAISPLPADYTKEDIGEFLRNPYGNEKQLRQVASALKWTAYPFFKITKTYQDIPTYRYYAKPTYIDEDRSSSKEFWREMTLIDKFNKAMRPDVFAHKVAGEAVTYGKVFYTPRVSVDKVHNKINYAFMQQLPQEWCYIIGFNNVSGYTISFDMMYFMQPGTDYTQFGDLFEPYINDMQRIFEPTEKKRSKFVYASKIDCKGYKINIYPENVAAEGKGNPRVFMQNGRWCYYVTLPIDRVWTFEIDDTTPAVASSLSGLMLTYSQQSDYEAAQLSLLLNPLIKIFTGEIPYFKENQGSTVEDGYRLSLGGRDMFETFFNLLMQSNNTGGATFFTAPVENIKSHDFSESANANEISESFNRYAGEKAGLSALIPVAEDVKAGQVEKSALLESRFSSATIYAQIERMMTYIYESFNLNSSYEFCMFGSIYTESTIRADAEKALSEGDISQRFILAALDGMSLLDKLSMSRTVMNSGLIDYLLPPPTSYTQTSEGGRPSKSIEDVGKGSASESLEDVIDTQGEAE